MSEPTMPEQTTPVPIAHPARPQRATSYLWRLLMLVPAIALMAYGYWRYVDVPTGGEVTAIHLKSKGGISGQVQDAYAGVALTTADYYLVVARREGDPLRLEPFKDTPLGNGLTWPLEKPLQLEDITRVEVWDHNAILKDKAIDRIGLPGDVWSAEGQTFRVEMIGTHEKPPRWALPLASVGATLAAVVLLKFVWDQAL